MYLSPNKAKVVLLENISETAVDFFKSKGFEDIVLLKESPNQDELKTIMKNVNILGIRSKTKISNELLKTADNLVAVGCFCIGSDTIDKQFSKEIGISVFNAPFSNTRSVAELIIGNMISLIRKIPEKNKLCHSGIWDKSAKNCFEVRNKTIGIIGYGHIGVQVGVLAEALSMKVLYYDVEKKLSIGSATSVETMEELLEKSDIVTLHVPKLESTINLIGDREFNLMKDGVIFLNASRGNVVNMEAMVKHLKNGKIFGAGIDVFPKEPASKEEEFVSELQEFDNVILTPHIGGSTEEAQKNIALDVAEKLTDYFLYGKTEGSLNFPEVNPTIDKNDSCRIVHIHKNLPGVMKELNEIFGNLNINISRQYLQTDSTIGYTLIDVEKTNSVLKIFEKIKNVKHTIKVRLLTKME